MRRLHSRQQAAAMPEVGAAPRCMSDSCTEQEKTQPWHSSCVQGIVDACRLTSYLTPVRTDTGSQGGGGGRLPSALVRLVDDFLLLTPSASAATAVLRRALQGGDACTSTNPHQH
jgi:hypothetical protein